MKFSRVNTKAAAESRLGAYAFRVLIGLGQFADADGIAWPSLATISRVTGIARTNLPKLIKQLEDTGYLTRERRVDECGDSTSTRYQLAFEVSSTEITGVIPTHDTRVIPPDDTVSSHGMTRGVIPLDALTTHKGTSQGTAHSEQPTLSLVEPSDSGFERFYGAFPLKKGRGQAERAYRAALKSATPETLLAGAIAYATERHGQDPKYTAYPATWLNGKRWLDAPMEIVNDYSAIGQKKSRPSTHLGLAAGFASALDLRGDEDR